MAQSELRAEAAGTLKIFETHDDLGDGSVVIGSVLGARIVGEDWTPGREPLTNHSANSMFKRRARAAGVDPKKAHWHGGRDSRAQQEWDGDTVSFADALYTQKLLGHKSMETTQRYGQKRFDLPVDKKADAVFAEMAPQQLKFEMAKGLKGA
jgi:integrase